MFRLLTFWFCIQVASLYAVVDSLPVAADYYYLRHDYRQAFQLWKEVYKRQPNSVHAMMRVSELKLMFENRQSSRDGVLKFLEANGDTLDPRVKKSIKEHLSSLQRTFVSDEVQSTYLQAKPKVSYKDWSGALQLLNQANNQDPGNFSILKDKANCEFQLGLWDKFIETTKLAYEAFPFDEEVLENFLEGAVYRQDYAAVVQAAKKDPESISTERQKTSLGYSLLETRLYSEGTSLLESLLTIKKNTTPSPAVYFALGKAFADKPELKQDAIGLFEKFLASMPREVPTVAMSWDPYRLNIKVEEAKKTLLQLKNSQI